jgi:hypothetical protein
MLDAGIPTWKRVEQRREVGHFHVHEQSVARKTIALHSHEHHSVLDEAFLDKPTTITGLLEAVSLLLYGRIKR